MYCDLHAQHGSFSIIWLLILFFGKNIVLSDFRIIHRILNWANRLNPNLLDLDSPAMRSFPLV